MLGLLNNEDLARSQFILGEDYAFYGLLLPVFLWDVEEVVKGYDFTKNSKRARVKAPDKYIRKWLQLRANAMVRSRSFDEAITPDFIRGIEVKECPVSRVALTYGTGEGTDWSVDRVSNDAGYAVGNVAILSTRVNSAKGNKSLEEVEARASGDIVDDSLTTTEWQRLAVLMAGPYSAVTGNDKFVPYIVHIPPTLACSWFIMLQSTIAQVATTANKQVESDWKKVFFPALSQKSRTLALEVIRKAKQKATRKNTGYVADIFAMPSVRHKFGQFLESLSDDEVHGVIEVCRKHSEIEYSGNTISSWKIGTKGFLGDKPEKPYPSN